MMLSPKVVFFTSISAWRLGINHNEKIVPEMTILPGLEKGHPNRDRDCSPAWVWKSQILCEPVVASS
jgi:hypothetical protein